MAIFSQLKTALKQYGFLNVLYLGSTKLAERFGYYRDNYTLFEKELISSEPVKPLASGYSFKELSPALLNNVNATWISPEQLSVFKSRLAKPGYFGLGIFKEGSSELVYYFWLNFERIEMPEYFDNCHSLKLGKDEAYLYDGFCHPDHRGKGFHGFSAQMLMNLACANGKVKTVTIIRTINKAAIASQEKVGFTPVKEIQFSGFRSRISCKIRNL